jgi:hypothetical protein
MSGEVVQQGQGVGVVRPLRGNRLHRGLADVPIGVVGGTVAEQGQGIGAGIPLRRTLSGATGLGTDIG